MKTGKTSRILSITLIMALIFIALPVTASAALADYDPVAVSAINGIIEKNGLSGYSISDPDNWDFAWWDDSVPKQLIEMDLTEKGLSGDLILTGLTSLKFFKCGANKLTSLDVTGCRALNKLYCYSNQLTSLDVSRNSVLQHLSCGDNRLTSLDVSNNKCLNTIACGFNRLTGLDITGLEDLYYLICTNNYMKSENDIVGYDSNKIEHFAFEPQNTDYAITAAAGEGGSISPSGDVSVSEGGSQTFVITPDEGYVISNVLVDGQSVGTVSSYTFENIASSHTIKAIFTPIYSIDILTDYEWTAYEWEVLRLANKERMAEGLLPLSTTPVMQKATDIRAEEITKQFSHTRPNGSICFTVLSDLDIDYGAAGENIAWGYSTPSEAVNGWMNSPGHRANILNSTYTHMGVGFESNCWVQLFVNTSPCNNISKISIASFTGNTVFSIGTEIDNLGLVVLFECSNHGTAYIPLISEMCNGYDNTRLGTQLVTVKYGNLQTKFNITLKINTAEKFKDLKDGAWYLDAVDFIVNYGLFEGVSDTEFNPDGNMSRAMFVQVLMRLSDKMGIDTSGDFTDTFKDVKSDAWYKKAVSWAVAKGLVTGYDADKFGPDDSITREQMAVMLIRFVDYAGITLDADANTQFSDAGKISSWAKDAVQRAAAGGLVSGVGDGHFDPLSTATRAQVAKLFGNLVDNYL